MSKRDLKTWRDIQEIRAGLAAMGWGQPRAVAVTPDEAFGIQPMVWSVPEGTPLEFRENVIESSTEDKS